MSTAPRTHDPAPRRARSFARRLVGVTALALTTALLLATAPAEASTGDTGLTVVAAPDFFAWASGLFESAKGLIFVGFLVVAAYVVAKAFFRGGAVAALITGVGAAVVFWVVQNTEFLTEIADATFGS